MRGSGPSTTLPTISAPVRRGVSGRWLPTRTWFEGLGGVRVVAGTEPRQWEGKAFQDLFFTRPHEPGGQHRRNWDEAYLWSDGSMTSEIREPRPVPEWVREIKLSELLELEPDFYCINCERGLCPFCRRDHTAACPVVAR
jgi:hypothetical protein